MDARELSKVIERALRCTENVCASLLRGNGPASLPWTKIHVWLMMKALQRCTRFGTGWAVG